MTATRQQLFDGSATAASESWNLSAGPLNLLYDTGTIRHIRYGGFPVLHQVYAAVRDQNWGTIAGEMSNHQLDVGESAFRIAYDMRHQSHGIDFIWHATIVGLADGTITFTFDGKANSDFFRNRIGFCVLHPMSLAGKPCLIEHVDGSEQSGMFPELVSPHQPFFNIRAISHEVSPGVRLRVLMEGDTFEMEDQRNWTDASYKTYCTPLGLPFPVQISAGDRITQSITISLQGDAQVTETADSGSILITAGEKTVMLCDLGLGLPSHREMSSDDEIRRLKMLNLSHLRGEVRLYQPDAETQLRYALDYVEAVDTALELVVFVSDNAEDELRQLANNLSATKVALSRITVFHQSEKMTRRQWVELARKHLSQFDVPIGGGTDGFFTELNRNRPPADALDFVTYSINPQVHAFDNLSLIEALAGHRPTIATARSFSQGKPLIISPVTFKMRWNPNATGDAPPTPAGQLPTQVDPRQMSLFGAGWTLGSIKYCAEAGVESVTYFETTGWRGVMETAGGSPVPEQFPSEAGTVFPMYHVFAVLGEFAGGEVVISQSSDPLRVETLWLRKGDQQRIILANLSSEQQSVGVVGIGSALQLRTLDEHSVLQAMRTPETFLNVTTEATFEAGRLKLSLAPYALVFLDTGT